MPSAPLPSPKSRRRPLLAALAVLLGAAGLGCVDHDNKGPIYVYDGSSGQVLEWDNKDTVYSAAGSTSAAADRTISGSFGGSSAALGWGGMVLDTSAQRLFLVYEDGTGYCIKKINDQNGSISGTDNIISFTLDNSGSTFSSGSFFGPAALDTSSHTLYVMETAQDGSSSRVWYLTGVNTMADGTSVTTSQTFNLSGDKYGVGLAAVPGGRFYGLFGYGNTVTDGVGNTYSGERLRMGSGSSWNGGANSQVLVGADTLMNLE